ncbi:hypothetical protein [Chitinophaga sp.]|uniref:hypothetical protein n=1 Tax=Chitinophaga sp. TaxID=1869181 RepID=UPI002625F503|nr:hypothetical protein [uncultured Chitinophaga sp.]
MNTLFAKWSRTAALVAGMATLGACVKYDDKISVGPGSGSENYAIWIQLGSWPNTSQYMVGSENLQGVVTLKNNGVEVTGNADYGIIARDGYYYYPSTSSNNRRLVKYSFKDNRLNTVKQVPFTYQSGVSTYCWIDENTFVLVGTDGAGQKVLCSVVNASDLSVKNSILPVGAIPAGYASVATRSLNYVDGKLFLTLAYTAQWPNPAYPKAVVAIIDFATQTLVKQVEDGRSVGAGISNMWMEATVVDDNSDYYMLSYPGWLSATMKSALYRIRKGATEFDASYFVDIEKELGGAGVALYGIGSGKALMKYKALPDDGTDAEHIMAYALVDLRQGKIIRKLTELPLDKGEMLQTITVDGNTAYIMVNAKNSKDYIWVYDIEKDTVTPGLEISGGYDYLLRVDKLK